MTLPQEEEERPGVRPEAGGISGVHPRQRPSAEPALRGMVMYVIPFGVLYLVTMAGLWRLPNALWGMYGNTDGMWAAWNIEGILEWGAAFDLSPFNPLSGMGSMFLPNLPWLNPAALSLGLPWPRDVRYLISYSIYFAELCLANVLLLRALGLSAVRSVVGAQIYAVTLFPPSGGAFLSLWWFSLAPVNAHLVAVANVILVLWIRVGRQRTRANLGCVGGMVVATLIGLVSAPLTFLTYIPTYALVGVALLLAQGRDRRSVFWKLAAAGVLAGALGMLGFPEYLRATLAVSARAIEFPAPFAPRSAMLSTEFWMNLWQEFEVCRRPQELLCPRYPIFWFHALALVGAGRELLWGRKLLRPLAAWFLCYVAAIHLYEFASYALLFGKLHVLSAPYLVWASYPFFALFFVSFVFMPLDAVARMAWRWHDARGKAQWMRIPEKLRGVAESMWSWRGWPVICRSLLLLVVPALGWYLSENMLPDRGAVPPKKTMLPFIGASALREPVVGPVTNYLVEHASVRPGRRFQGYTATYFGDRAGHIRYGVGYTSPNMAAHIYVEARQYLDQHYGNRFQETDLWAFNIPTFEEYGQWVTQQAYTFATALFSSGGDVVHPVFLRIYQVDVDLLRMLGVRFLIADLQLDDSRLTLRAKQTSTTAGPIYLYEIAGANLGTYSPTRPIRVGTFAEALEMLRRRKESLSEEVIVFEPLPDGLRPARTVEMRVGRDGLRIAAQSAGRSLVLLPVQFSRCLQLRPGPGGSEVPAGRLHRANGLHTLLEFEGRIDAVVKFEFGLGGASQCRLQDARELDDLGLRAVPR